MATESPMRMDEIVEDLDSPDSPAYPTPLRKMSEEWEIFMREQNLRNDQADKGINRSGSAPPTIEGSFAAIGHLLAQQNTQVDSNSENVCSAIENRDFEERILSDPAYFAYYCANINLNPRLPPPLISRENQRLVRHIGAFGNNSRSNSLVAGEENPLQPSHTTLPTHMEEPGEDRSPEQGSDHQLDDSSIYGQDTPLSGRHKSLVDLIQEDFPRTPSPVYRSSVHAAEGPADGDLILNMSSLAISQQSEPSSGSIVDGEEKSSPDATAPKSTSEKDFAGRNDASTSGNTGLDVSTMNSGIQSSGGFMQPFVRNVPPRHSMMQQGGSYQDQGGQSQMIDQGVNLNVSQGQPMLSIGGQPPLHYPGVSPPVFATPPAYMTFGNPYFPNFQTFSPPYSFGYGLGSTILPPFIAGYTPHSTVPMPFNATSGPSVSGRVADVSTGDSIPHSSLENINNFYGQQGLIPQPPYMGPFHMACLQSPYGDVYGTSSQFGSRSNIAASPAYVTSQQEHIGPTNVSEQNFLPTRNRNLAILDTARIGAPSGNIYGNPNIGLMPHFPVSPLSSPVLPSSPAGGTINFGRQSEVRFTQSPRRNSVLYPGLQGQRGVSSFDDSNRQSALEELKSGNARRYEFSDIVGRVVEFSVDQHGSRFIQQKLESCNAEEKESLLKEILPHALTLITDVFGNYVIQKCFEHGTPEQRKELADQIAGRVLCFSLQMYGCRVIQKALEVLELNEKIQLVNELDGHVMKCVRDQNGNHVIQKCIERVPAENIEFIISAFYGQAATLSTHPYGCRVIQRILERCSDEQQSKFIVDEILEFTSDLAGDQYGNYVIQHVLEWGKPHERSQVINQFSGKVVQMSQHKYASNVIEKCFQYGNESERELLINEIMGQTEGSDHLLVMMKDQYANYVVQKILETANEEQRAMLLSRVRVHLNALKKYTYGKHIVARYERLFGEVGQSSKT